MEGTDKLIFGSIVTYAECDNCSIKSCGDVLTQTMLNFTATLREKQTLSSWMKLTRNSLYCLWHFIGLRTEVCVFRTETFNYERITSKQFTRLFHRNRASNCRHCETNAEFVYRVQYRTERDKTGKKTLNPPAVPFTQCPTILQA
jgi:hypothetical protein